MSWRGAFLLALIPLAVQGQTLSLPGNAEMTFQDNAGLATLAVPVDIWADGHVPTLPFEGFLTRTGWRLNVAGISTLQILRPLRDQLRNAGFDILLDCQTEACGGFDFRFSVDVAPPPAMQVNLGDFRYMAATKGDEAVTLMISRTEAAAFVQVTRISSEALQASDAQAATLRAAGPGNDRDLSAALADQGRFVLQGLEFETGSAQLGSGPIPALSELAAFLSDNPATRVALVGHTDSSGSLDANIALSKRRAASVLERLVAEYGVDRQRVEAQGNGYLSPIADNRTEEGRDANRRVEVIVTSTR